MNSGSCWGKSGGIELEPLVQYARLTGAPVVATAGAARRVSPELQRGLVDKGKSATHTQFSNTDDEFANALERRLQRALAHDAERPHGYGAKSMADPYGEKGSKRSSISKSESKRSSASKSESDRKSSTSSKDLGTSSSSRSTSRRPSMQRRSSKNWDDSIAWTKRGFDRGSPCNMVLPDIAGGLPPLAQPPGSHNAASTTHGHRPRARNHCGGGEGARMHICNSAYRHFSDLTPGAPPPAVAKQRTPPAVAKQRTPPAVAKQRTPVVPPRATELPPVSLQRAPVVTPRAS